MTYNSDCLIWRGFLATEKQTGRDGRCLDSPRTGGKYFISGSAVPGLENIDDDIRVRLTDWLIEQRQLGTSFPEINTTIVKQSKQWKDREVDDRADSVLRYLSAKSKILGAPIYFALEHNQYAHTIHLVTKCELLAHSGCVGESDFDFLLRYLENKGLIERHNLNNPLQSCVLTVEGHSRVSDLEFSRIDSATAFVAMWFDDSLTEAWENGFKPAVTDVGYKPVRIDQKEHLNKIDDEIIAEIRKSRFVIADFTHGEDGARGGVYFEAGFALGLDIPVIFSCRKDVLEKVHFDTRQYNHIVWETADELRKLLTHRIAAVIGEGPNK